MSMCTLGMAEEFKDEVACNSIWPMTPIWVRKKTACLRLKNQKAETRTRELSINLIFLF